MDEAFSIHNEKHRHRLRMAFLLVQIALVEWVIYTLLWRTDWLWQPRATMGAIWWIQNVSFVCSIVRWLVLMTAVWMFSRGLRMWRSQIGAILIFNFLLITFVKNLLLAVNWAWQLAGHDTALVLEDPLAVYFTWIGPWNWLAIWLLMIYGGVKIARDINAQFNGALLSPRRITLTFFMAIVALMTHGFEIFQFQSVSRGLFPDVDESNILRFRIVMTLLQVAVAAPAIVFCLMLLTALRRVRRVLRSPTLRVCSNCSHTLHESNAGRCPECGWAAGSARPETS